MTAAVVFASEMTEKTIWNPTLLGWAVFVCAIVLFCGSIYLLLATNVGARLGFLLSGAGLSGLMVLMSIMWVTTAYPLNTLRGTLAGWTPIAITAQTGDEIDVAALRNASSEGQNLWEENRAEFANIKAVADTALVIPAAEGGVTPEPSEFQLAGGFQSSDAFLVSNIWEVVEDEPIFFKDRRFALIEFCSVADGTPADGEASATCDDKARFLAVEYDYGSLRVPPLVALGASLVAFVLFLLALHWYETDKREAESAGLPEKVGTK